MFLYTIPKYMASDPFYEMSSYFRLFFVIAFMGPMIIYNTEFILV